MDSTPLVFGLRKHFAYGFQHAKTLATHDEFYAVQTTAAEPLEETDQAGLVLFHTLSSVHNLTISVLIDCNSNPNSYIFKFPPQFRRR